MKKIRAHCGIGFVGATYEEEFEFDDDMTDDEIGKQMLIPKSSVQYNRKSAINYIREKMKRRK